LKEKKVFNRLFSFGKILAAGTGLRLKLFPYLLMTIGAGFYPAEAEAQGLGDLGRNVTDNISGVAKAILVGGFALGLYLVIAGLMEFYNSSRKPNCSFAGGAIKCVIGACLLAVEAMIASFSTTIFGGDESSSGLGVLGF
jgi:hypothetical protein